jgi:hypothetical protein
LVLKLTHKNPNKPTSKPAVLQEMTVCFEYFLWMIFNNNQSEFDELLLFYWCLAKRLLKRSTRPPVSTNLCFPVKNGWQFEHISTRISFLVEAVSILFPHAQVISVGAYAGWIPVFILVSPLF